MERKKIVSKQQSLFMQNLLALGFNTATETKEHKITFDKNMFCLPNQKAFEVVTHFLFSKLNEVSDKKYSILWPLMDPKDRRQFQKATFDYLRSIAQESEIKFPLVSASVISSFGEAFYNLYFAFSTHVVLQVNKSYDTPILRRPESSKTSIELLQGMVISTVEKFIALTDATKCHLEIYFGSAKKLTACVDELKLAIPSNKSILEEKIKQAIVVFAQQTTSRESSLSGFKVRSQEYKEKVEALWEKLETFLTKEVLLWNCVSSELEKDDAKPILKGRNFMFPISNKLEVAYKEKYGELSETEVSERNESLAILQFVELINIVLEFYVTSIEKGNFSDTYLCKSLKDKAGLESTLKMLKSMCALLEENNKTNKQHVESLVDGFSLPDLVENEASFAGDLPPLPSECSNSSVVSEVLRKDSFFSFENADAEDPSAILPESNTAERAPGELKVNEQKMDTFAPKDEEVFNDFTHTISEKKCEISTQRISITDRVSNSNEFEMSLLEDSLNSQTLSDQVSFLD